MARLWKNYLRRAIAIAAWVYELRDVHAERNSRRSACKPGQPRWSSAL
jgi:hypothetical protein